MFKQNRPTANSLHYQRKPLITALEQRILLDGAAVAAIAEATTDVAAQEAQVHQESAETAVHFDAVAPAATEAEPERREVAFVDTQVEDYQILIDSLDAGIEVHLIDNGVDGLEAMVSMLSQVSGIDAMHVFSHGDVGELHLGNTLLTLDNLNSRAELLSELGAALSEDGDLLLYGCYIGLDDQGMDFIERFAELSGADVAASDDLTGAAELDGDWELEIASGPVEATAASIAGYDGVLSTTNLINGLGGSAGFGEFAHSRNDDTATGAIDITGIFGAQGVRFGNTYYTDVYINNNGVLNFGGSTTSFTPGGLSSGVEGKPAIALYWTDLDTRSGTVTASADGGTSTGSNLIYWDVDTTNKRLTITWDDVGEYSSGTTSKIAGQIVLEAAGAAGSGDMDFSLRYEYAVAMDSHNVQAGWNIGVSGGTSGVDYYEIPLNGSGPSALADLDTRAGNTGTIGIWEFALRGGGVSDAGVVSIDTNEDQTYTFAADAFQAGGGTASKIQVTTLPSNGVLQLSGTPISADVDIASADYANLTYVPNADVNGSDTFSWKGWDGSAWTDSSDASVTIASVNDEPSFTVGGDQLVNEDAGAKSISDWATGISAGASNESSQTLTFTTNNNNNSLFSVQPTVSSSGVLSYTSAANAYGSATVSVYLSDNGGTANGGDNTSPTQTFTITVDPVNDSPLFTGNGVLSAVNEDVLSPSGATVTSLFNTLFSDNDPTDTLSGVAITTDASTSGQGEWQYTTDGSNWYAIGSVSTSSGLMLSSSSELRFVPAENYNSTPGALSVHAVDSSNSASFTSGATRETFDTTSDGSSSAVSASAVLLNTSITAVNDPPVVSADPASATLVEAGGVTNGTAGVDLSTIQLNKSDVDGTPSFDTAWLLGQGWTTVDGGVNYSKVGTYGTATLTISSSVVTYAVNNNDTDTQLLRAGDSVNDSFTIQVTDNGSPTPVKTSQVDAVFSLQGADDNPVAGDDTGAAVEAGGVANGTAGSNASGNVLTDDADVDSGESKAVSAIRTGAEGGSGTAGSVGSALAGQYGSLTLNSDGSYTYVVNEDSAAVQALRINGDTVTDSFTYTVLDSGSLTDQATLAVTINGRNDAPVVTADPASTILVEAGGVTNGTAGVDLSTIQLNKSDVDGTPSFDTVWLLGQGWTTVDGGLSYSKIGTYGTATLTISSSVVTYAVDNNDTDTQLLRAGDSVTDSFNIQVMDNGGTPVAYTDQVNAVFSLQGADDNPVAGDDTGAAVEAGGVANGTAGSNASGNVLTDDTDVDSGESKAVSAIRTGAEGGSGTTGSVGSALAGQYGSLTLNSDGSYTYVVDEDSAAVQALRITGQQLTDSFTYTVKDSGDLTDQATLSITIDGRNDAPYLTTNEVEDTWLFGKTDTRDFATFFDDVDSTANGEDLTFTITGLPAGLIYSTDTGLVSGKPTAIGKFTLTLTAQDVSGASIGRQFELEIVAPPKEAPPPPPPAPDLPPPLPETDGIPVGNEFTDLPDGLVGKDGGSGDSGEPGEGSGFMQVGSDGDGDSGDGSEQVLLAEQGTLVVKSTNVDGNTTLKAEVDVNVTTDGKVVFNDAQREAFDIISLSMSSIQIQDGWIEISLEDSRAHKAELYVGSLANGDALPSWVTVDTATGGVSINPPPGVDELIMRIKVIDSDGQIRILELKLDLKGLRENLSGAVLQAGPMVADAFVPLSEQLQVANQSAYGERLTSLFSSW